MTAAVQDELDVIVTAWVPSQRDSRRAVVRAVMADASAHRGLVHASTMREHLPPWMSPHVPGAVVCALVRMGYLTPTGRYRPNGQEESRNRAKPSEVRRLVKAIPPDLFDNA